MLIPRASEHLPFSHIQKWMEMEQPHNLDNQLFLFFSTFLPFHLFSALLMKKRKRFPFKWLSFCVLYSPSVLLHSIHVLKHILMAFCSIGACPFKNNTNVSQQCNDIVHFEILISYFSENFPDKIVDSIMPSLCHNLQRHKFLWPTAVNPFYPSQFSNGWVAHDYHQLNISTIPFSLSGHRLSSKVFIFRSSGKMIMVNYYFVKKLFFILYIRSFKLSNLLPPFSNPIPQCNDCSSYCRCSTSLWWQSKIIVQ